jgi:hypothetical protein
MGTSNTHEEQSYNILVTKSHNRERLKDKGLDVPVILKRVLDKYAKI